MIAYDRLSQIIPPDQALANKALQVSFQQIKNVSQLLLPGLASAYEYIETTKDLPLISALEQPVPDDVINYYKTAFATGSGVDDNIAVTDLIGAAAGAGYTQPINNCVSIINSLTDDGTLTNLITTYTRMENTVNGVYGNAVTGPIVIPAGIGNGTYSDANDAVSVLIGNAQTYINAAVSANSSATTSLNTEFNNMAIKLVTEYDNQVLAGITISELLTDARDPLLAFVQMLPNYGLDIIENGASWYLEQVSDLTVIGGEAIVGCLRQGRNTVVMQTVGVGFDTEIPSEPTQTPTKATFIPSTYTESQAANLVIK